MAVYKPTYCYPYLEAVDLTIPDGEKYFTCQMETSNIKITGYRVELYNENNEKVFSPYKGKILLHILRYINILMILIL